MSLKGLLLCHESDPDGQDDGRPHNARLVSLHIVIRCRRRPFCKSVDANQGLVRHPPAAGAALPFCVRGRAGAAAHRELGERGNRDETASGMNGSN